MESYIIREEGRTSALEVLERELAYKTDQLKKLVATLEDVLGIVRTRELIAKITQG